ncbi:Uncharacterised protein [Delftia tsuruhatensis]|nr:Uncharacterised protein [Delftia tsuruhatensis]CAC9681440.1 Uncharacterised protein [Delftia tsuruhatensis]
MILFYRPGPVCGSNGGRPVDAGTNGSSCSQPPSQGGRGIEDSEPMYVGDQWNPRYDPAAIHKTTPRNGSRPLTFGERHIVRQIFGDSVDCSMVRIYRGRFIPFQPSHTAMAPAGDIFFPTPLFSEDYSVEEKSWKRSIFIHEMTHIWQYQQGYPVMARGAIRLGLDYDYELSVDKKLSDYNMEAQGNIIADYYSLKFLKDINAMRNERYFNEKWMPLYEKILADFFDDPKNSKNLP